MSSIQTNTSQKAPIGTRARRFLKVAICNIKKIDRDLDSDDERHAQEYMMRRDAGESRMSVGRMVSGVSGSLKRRRTGREEGERDDLGGDEGTYDEKGEKWMM